MNQPRCRSLAHPRLSAATAPRFVVTCVSWCQSKLDALASDRFFRAGTCVDRTAASAVRLILNGKSFNAQPQAPARENSRRLRLGVKR